MPCLDAQYKVDMLGSLTESWFHHHVMRKFRVHTVPKVPTHCTSVHLNKLVQTSRYLFQGTGLIMGMLPGQPSTAGASDSVHQRFPDCAMLQR